MTRFIYNMAFAALMVVAVYFFASAIIPMELLMVPLTGAALGAALLVCIVYAPLFWQSTWRVQNRVGVLAIGMGLLWASFIGSRATSAVYRAAGQTDQLANNRLIGFFILMGLIAAIFHVAAPGYPPDGFKEKLGGRYRWLIVGFVVGGALLSLTLSHMGIRL